MRERNRHRRSSLEAGSRDPLTFLILGYSDARPGLGDFLERALVEKGRRVLRTTSGKEAARAALRLKHEVVILDVKVARPSRSALRQKGLRSGLGQ